MTHNIRIISSTGNVYSDNASFTMKFEDVDRGLGADVNATTDLVPASIQAELDAVYGRVFIVDGKQMKTDYYQHVPIKPKTIERLFEFLFDGTEARAELAFNTGYNNKMFYRVWVESV